MHLSCGCVTFCNIKTTKDYHSYVTKTPLYITAACSGWVCRMFKKSINLRLLNLELMNKKGDEKLWYRGGTFAKLLLGSKRNKYYIICVSVALFIPNVNLIFICRIILQWAACCAALPFVTLSYKRHEFRRRFIQTKVRVPNFSTSFV